MLKQRRRRETTRESETLIALFTTPRKCLVKMSPSLACRVSGALLNVQHHHVRHCVVRLKTGMFKWSKDYDTASKCYENAAAKFNAAMMLVEARNNFVKASDCKMKSSSKAPFFAAKLLEQACSCAERQLEEVEEGSAEARDLATESAEYMLRANVYYQTNGNWDRALEAIQKAGKVCERDAPDQALRNYMQMGTVTIYLEQAGKVLAIDAFREAISFSVRNQSFSEAIELLQLFRRFLIDLDQMQDLRKACLSTVILHLANGDGAAAESSMKTLYDEAESFRGSDDYEIATDILSAFADRDDTALLACKKHDRILTLDPAVVRCFGRLNTSAATIHSSFSTKQVLDLNNEGPGGDSGDLDLTGGNATKPAAPADDDLC